MARDHPNANTARSRAETLEEIGEELGYGLKT